MLGWLRRQRETAERIEAEAEAVMRAYAARAYAEARRREREAKSKAEAQNWSRVALTIAHKTRRRVANGVGGMSLVARRMRSAQSRRPKRLQLTATAVRRFAPFTLPPR